MATVSKKFGFLRTTLALWAGNLFAGRAGVVTDSTPGPVERWGWYDGSAWKFSARSGENETFGTLTLNGATRPAWAIGAHVFDSLSSTWQSVGKNFRFGRNVFYAADTQFKAIESATGTNYPATFSLMVDGSLNYATSTADPVAGATVTMTTRWQVSKEGGCGFFGANPPTTRPTVNAACTDLATVIALTNQLRTHLIACGLVQ